MTSIVNECRIPSALERWRRRFRVAALYAAGFAVMTLGSVIVLAVAVATLFRARRLYTEVLIARMARTALWIAGIRYVVHGAPLRADPQTIYIANHGSTLDVFILTAMGLPNTRFFLSGHLRKNLPLGLLGYLAGTFWTMPQCFPERRTALFRRAERVLRRTGESVFLSPEGQNGNPGAIGAFNKGAFHLAASLAAPITPMYIRIPPEIDPGWGYDYRPGVVDVYLQTPVPTKDWRLDELEDRRTEMRNYFLELQTRYHGERQ